MSFVLERLPETDDELYWLVRAMWGVTIPRTKVCIDHVAPFTAFADAFFKRNSLNPDSPVQDTALWHGSRGLSGKSYMLAILGLTQAVLMGQEVVLLGGSFEQSKNIHIHMRNSWEFENAPSYMIAHDATTEVRLTNGAKIRPITASQKTARGPHPPLLLLDEIDEMDQEILDAAMGQPMEQENYLGVDVQPYAVMCSTWQNPQGTFTTMRKRAEEQEIPIYQWCYRESANEIDGWLSQESIQKAKARISKVMWETEYELNEPAIGNRAFDPAAVERAFSLPFEPIDSSEKKDFEEFRFEKFERDGKYVAGADWAKEQDYTVIAVGRVDITPHRLVYYARFNRLPYPIMIDYFNRAIQEYDAYPIHDGTGLGNVVQDHLDERARPFYMIGDKRARMLSEYVNAIESDKWRFPKVKSAYLETKFCQVGDLYHGHTKDFHLPDSVCAFALMEYQARRFAPMVGPEILKKPIPDTNRYAKVLDRPRADGEVEIMTEAPSNWELTV